MKQSGFRLILFAICIFSLLTSHGENYWVNGFEYEFNGTEATVTSCGLSGDIVIPDKVTYDGVTYIVTTIGNLAFYCDHKVTSIRIPNTVTSIKNNAFIYASELKSVYFPSSIMEIEGYVFYDNASLTTLYCMVPSPPYPIDGSAGPIENTVTLYVPSGSFEAYRSAPYWKDFKNIVPIDEWDFVEEGIYYHIIDEDNVSVTFREPGFGAYSGSIVIPETVIHNGITYHVTEIAASAFAYCNNLTSVSIPVTITSIGNDAFTGCSIQSLIITGNGAWTAGSLNLSLSNLFIGNNVISIAGMGVEASDIYSFASNPPICDEYTFLSYDGALHVPPTSFSAYFTASYWNYFLNIIGDADFAWPVAVNLNQSNALLEIGEEMALTASLTPTESNYNTIFWTSSNPNVAIVNDGIVSALASGECDIMATCMTASATCHIVVVEKKIYISLDKNQASVLPNHMITLIPTVTPVSTDLKVTSSDPTVAAARIVNGVIQVAGISEGSVTITVGSVDGYAIADSCQVTVYTEIGDVNCDGFVNISDVTDLIDYLLSGNDSSVSQTNADCDKDGKVNIADVTTLIDFLLSERWPWEPDHEWVDLGLPSGILWATCNVGANAPEEYGDYFAWGETEPKSVYNWSTYKWCNGSYYTLTKYNNNSSYGTVDNKTKLDPEDDAAYVNWGEMWRIPSKNQIKELINNCLWKWTQLNGVKGYLVTGPNGNTMFLPAAGYRDGSSSPFYISGAYWSCNFKFPEYAYYMDFNSEGMYWDGGSRRYLGFPVRAVRASQN